MRFATDPTDESVAGTCAWLGSRASTSGTCSAPERKTDAGWRDGDARRRARTAAAIEDSPDSTCRSTTSTSCAGCTTSTPPEVESGEVHETDRSDPMELSRTSGTTTLSASKVSSDTRERSKRRVDSSQTLSAPPSLERSTSQKGCSFTPRRDLGELFGHRVRKNELRTGVKGIWAADRPPIHRDGRSC